MKSKNQIIQRVIAHFGSQDKLGKALDISQSAISQWLNNRCGIEPYNALKIEILTNGEFKALDLCPNAKDELDCLKTLYQTNSQQVDKP